MAKSSTVFSTAEGLQWIDVEEPSLDVVKKLQRKYSFHRLDTEDILSPAQRPKLESHANYTFLIFRFPASKSRSKRTRATELDVVIKKNTVITFHGHDLKQVRGKISDTKLFAKKRRHLMSKGPAFLLYEILLALFNDIYDLSDDISRQLDALETQLFDSRHRNNRDTITTIARLRRHMIDYQKISKPQASFISQIINRDNSIVAGQEKQWRNLLEIADGQWELFDTLGDSLNGLTNTHNSLVSHRFNQTVRLLTIISVLFLPATFLLDILSTDTPGSPLSNQSQGFLLVLGSLLLVQLLFLWFLRRRHVI